MGGKPEDKHRRKGFDTAIQLWQPASIQAWEGLSMPKEEWGVKRLCPATGKRFYDMNKTPVISPYTGEIVPIDLPGRKGSIATAPEPSKSKAKVVADVDADDVLLDDDEDVTVDADDELLEDEDDDTVSFDELGDVASDADDET